MQDSVTMAYKGIADSLSDWIAPVGEAWRLVINQTGMVLHDADNSHPNLKGSYLAACVFYDVIFGKPSTGNSFTAGLSPDSALLLQQAADSITFGYAVHWNLNNDIPHAAFSLTISGDTVFTHNLSSGAVNWLWDFGDGQTSQQFEPVHVYPGPGTWQVKLKACNNCFCDSTAKTATITTTGITTASANHPVISLLGPDPNGVIRILNFSEDGTLIFYDITGKVKASLAVKSGIAQTSDLRQGLWIWKLVNTKNEEVESGKIIFPWSFNN
jgi:PKD repeat protein